MSFCCICNNLLSLNIKILIKRIERLLISYILSPITIWTINDILSAIFSLFFLFFLYQKFIIIYINRYRCTFQMLEMKLLWGSDFIPQFLYLLEFDCSDYSFIYYNIYFQKAISICFLFIVDIIL